MLSTWKHKAVRCLPGPVTRWLKKMYYPRLVLNFPESRWPGAEVVRKLVGPGDCVVDAGANIGYVSALLARWVGETGIVHAFEPVPETYELLQHNMRKTGLHQVVTHAVALSSTRGKAQMALAEYPDGGRNLYESRMARAGEQMGAMVPVEQETLDAVAGSWGRKVSFIKIDVEGHELEVIRGATNTLMKDRPSLYIEVSGDPDVPLSSASELVKCLSALGYGAYCSSGSSVRSRQVGDRVTDYFFLLPEHNALLS